jgi:hypothetical protein
MTYPNRETERERKVNRYNILHWKPKGTQKEQAIMNAVILNELLQDDGLQNILPFAHFQRLCVFTQESVKQNMSVCFTIFADQNSLELPYVGDGVLQTPPLEAVFYTGPQVYSLGASEMLLPSYMDATADVAAEEATKLLADLYPQNSETIINSVRVLATENKARPSTSNAIQSLKPDPNKAVIIPEIIEGTYFCFFVTVWLIE